MREWNPATGRPVGAPLHASAQNGGVHVVAFSPNGKLLAGGSGDGTVRLWNPAARRPVGVLQTGTGPNTGVWAVAFSPDGKLLAAGCGDGTVRLWNPATGRPVATLHATTRSVYGAHAVAFSPNGKLLASGEGDGTVREWNPATRRPVGAPIQTGSSPADALSVLAFSPDGKQLGRRQLRRHRAAVASIAIRARLCTALRRRGTTDTARMEPLRLRRTAAEGLRLNP